MSELVAETVSGGVVDRKKVQISIGIRIFGFERDRISLLFTMDAVKSPVRRCSISSNCNNRKVVKFQGRLPIPWGIVVVDLLSNPL